MKKVFDPVWHMNIGMLYLHNQKYRRLCYETVEGEVDEESRYSAEEID